MKQRYHHTEHTDTIIRRAYSSEHYGSKSRKAILSAAKALGWPKHTIYRRALKLGCIQAREKEPNWTEAEMELLERNAHLDPFVIARKFRAAGFQRTPTAITIRRKRFLNLDLSQARQDAGIYSARQAGVLMGLDAHAVSRWIDKGWLRAQRAGTQRTEAQHGDHWQIREADLKAFIINYTAHVDFRKIDKYWLVDLLTGAGAKAAASEAA